MKDSRTIREVRWQLELFERIFDSFFNGAMITDPDGYVTHLNKPYADFLRIDKDAYIGRHCTEVVENTRMHIVAKTGKAELNHIQKIRGQNILVHRIPIKKKGKVIAVFGIVMFQNIKDLRALADKFSMLKSKVEFYEKELLELRSTRYTFDSIIGKSRVIQDLKREAMKATANKFPVLITGQSGTGKELFAQAIHQGSPRKFHPFVRINCAAIPRDLLESELFGYARGAFTGAGANGKPGKFELAHLGTVFLDEIGDLPLDMQPKLLRVLEEKEFERVGGTKTIRSDFRIIAATNHNLEKSMSDGKFRKDLFYRLNVISLHIPPLSERKEDILPLAVHFIEHVARESAGPVVNIDPKAERVLESYGWPGNIRELSNVIERTLSSLEGNTIHSCDLPFFLFSKTGKDPSEKRASIRNVQRRAESEAIRYALKESGYNKTKAAKILGIHRTLLYKKMKRYGIGLSPE